MGSFFGPIQSKGSVEICILSCLTETAHVSHCYRLSNSSILSITKYLRGKHIKAMKIDNKWKQIENLVLPRQIF
jgi:hypothetical protein